MRAERRREIDAILQRRGIADFDLMARVLQQAKACNCLLRLDLSPGDPRKDKRISVSCHARIVHSDLLRAIVETKSPVETISTDRLRHRDLEDVLEGRKDKLAELFCINPGDCSDTGT